MRASPCAEPTAPRFKGQGQGKGKEGLLMAPGSCSGVRPCERASPWLSEEAGQMFTSEYYRASE